ncbi:sphingolipid transporter Ecym_7320 [Eremothecium cymbalariae DBVPG|uniref:SSD domain-containing protein n=1 Tax=Eremothecium cymbalariae (strain CBS 270.75 / DBVPG 7215 / KCTC 17166 / NRRL Y-17582) TaxID=931890 RepID=G8JWD9_ERECY|nr:hypothetical protein Ecym_7320 [Eremothecium cymbalariae DBVPG\
MIRSTILWGIYMLLNLSVCYAKPECAIYSSCGKKSLFGASLPCSVSKEFTPEPLSKNDVKLLVEVCGKEWDGMDHLCCNREQIISLKKNLKKANGIIASCPACKKNFQDLFCHFTCSPDQRTFINVTKTQQSLQKKEIVTELSFFMSTDFASMFYDSCKDVKFSATNGYAMDLIGGGATDYEGFLKFLGDEKPMLGGSPFQINFVYNSSTDVYQDFNETAYLCNDTTYKCACTDCQGSCPNLKEIKSGSCKVAGLPCFSFGTLIAFAAVTVAMGVFHVYLFNKKNVKSILTNDDGVLNNLQDSDTNDDRLFHQYPTTRYGFNDKISDTINIVAEFCVDKPYYVVIGVVIVVSALASLIVLFAELETDPVNLWVDKNSKEYQQKQYFDENFGPFYRIEQIFVVDETEPVLSYDLLKWWFEVEDQITKKFKSRDNISYQDICLRPTPDSTCVIESFTQYFHGDLPSETEWKARLKSCADYPVNCLPTFQQPLKSSSLFSDKNVLEANAFVVTLLVDNHEDLAKNWEKELVAYLLNLKVPTGKRISFSTESSLNKELKGNSDVAIVIMSYLLMFLYVSWALKNKAGKNRFLLGVAGILIVFGSVLSSAGLLSVLGVKSTLIIAEVIPFLILAIGVDNIFLITAEYDRITENNYSLDVASRILMAVRRISPSVVTSVCSQILCFLLASVVPMPAVRNFAIYSAVALFCNFILQITGYVSILTLYEIKFEKYLSSGNTNRYKSTNRFSKKIKQSVKKRKKIVGIFSLWVIFSMVFLPYVPIGLDQRMAIPEKSYLSDYFSDLFEYLNVGPPVYFILRNFDLTKRTNQQKICGKFTSCDESSLANVLEQERFRSSISEPLANWFDDFMLFLNPELDECCRFKKGTHDICPPFYSRMRCETCLAPGTWDYDMSNFPEGKTFMEYFNIWINSPSDSCPLAGKAPYSKSIIYNDTAIISSVFRSQHHPLRSPDDYIKATLDADRITNELDGFDLFAYSPFYVFFSQYQTLLPLTIKLLGLSFIIVFMVSLILVGSIGTSIVLTTTVFMILIDIMACMALFNIPLNAVSLVNLVICVGLAVEICIHIARAFTMVPVGVKSDSISRSSYAISTVGESVWKGIIMTKLVGVSVLGLAKSKIFKVFYFRMWLILILIASLHALIFLPAFLAIFGGKSYVDGDSEIRLNTDNDDED